MLKSQRILVTFHEAAANFVCLLKSFNQFLVYLHKPRFSGIFVSPKQPNRYRAQISLGYFNQKLSSLLLIFQNFCGIIILI